MSKPIGRIPLGVPPRRLFLFLVVQGVHNDCPEGVRWSSLVRALRSGLHKRQ